jgi:ATP-binding cassette, subfamily B, bacterial PglK
MRTYLAKIFYILGNDKKKIPFLVLIFIVSSVFDLIGIGLMGPYIASIVDINTGFKFIGNNNIFPQERESFLLVVSYILLATFFIKMVFSILINKNIIQFGENLQVRLKLFLMMSYQSIPYTRYISRNSSEYIYSIQQLTGQYSGQTVVPLLRTVSDSIVALVLFIFLAWQNIYALLLLVGLLVSAIFTYYFFIKDNIKVFGQGANVASAKTIQGINEGMEGLKEIRILGKEEYFYNLIKQGAKSQAFFITKATTLSIMPRYMLEFVIISFVILLVLGSILLNNDLDMLLPTLGVFGVASIRLLPIVTTFAHSLVQLRYGYDSVTRLYSDLQDLKLFSVKNIVTEFDETLAQFQMLKLDRVNYTHPHSKNKTLNEVSLEIKSGESIGLIGPSGSGKTTLVDMILGLLEPQQGRVEFNGKRVEVVLKAWQSKVAYLPQHVFLIDDTLRNNVALGVVNEEIDDNKLQESLRQSKLMEVVEQLPQGVNTVLGERGIRLSGGQRQRVALARAFYHDRSILIMDEATSALDNETEQEIVEEINRLKGEKTMIVIAHRLTTLRHCDRIYKLEKGKVVSAGTYKELIGSV